MTSEKKMSKKSTNAELGRRVEQVAELVLNGHSYLEICRYAAETWQISSRQTDRYVVEAKGRIAANVEVKVGKIFEIALGRLEHIFRLAMESKKYMTALEAQKDINNLIGLYPPRKQEIKLSDMTDEELDQAIRELDAKL